MKKLMCLLSGLVFLLALSGCTENGLYGRAESQQTGVKGVLEAGMDDSTEPGAEPEAEAEPETEAVPADKTEVSSDSAEGIDIDLTELSATMVYAEVYNMMTSPESYVGKTVKMGGTFASYHDEASGNDYFACIVADATACCAQGIEFTLKGDYSYPDDYPEEGGDICVVGVFETYEEGDNTYCRIRDAGIV